MGQRVEIDGKLYNVDSADETVAHLSVVSSSSESNHDPEHRTEPVSAVLTRIADQGRELAPNISAYQALRAEHPEKLIGVRVGERLLFWRGCRTSRQRFESPPAATRYSRYGRNRCDRL